MKINVYALCWNEEVILPYFLKHYEKIAEKIIVYDNMSTDGSLDILKAHPKVEIRSFNSNNEFRDDIHRDIKNNCWKEARGKVDWVIILDMDEFIYHDDLKGFLKCQLSGGTTLCKPKGYLMVSEKLPTTKGMIYEEIKTGVPQEASSKPVIFNPNKIEEINFSSGAHSCEPVGEINLYESTGVLKLLHYKVLSLDYLLTRSRQCKERLSDVNKANNWGKHYMVDEQIKTQKFFERLKEAKMVI